MDLSIFSTFTLSSKTDPQRLSDDESLEDHCSSIEDFQGVTLQLDYSRNQTPVSPASDRFLCDDNPKWEKERKELLSLSGERGSSTMHSSTSELPQISITPMTPPFTGLGSPDAQSTVSLNSSNASPMHRPLPQSIPPAGERQQTPTKYWGAQTPPSATAVPANNDMEAKDFFACRDSIIQNAIDEVQSLVEPEQDGGVRGTWLLTE